jgi:hypothetical protein
VEIRAAKIDGMIAVMGTGSLLLREAVVSAELDVSAHARLERVQVQGAIDLKGTLEASAVEVRGANLFLTSSGSAVLENVAILGGSASAIESSGELRLSRSLVEARALLARGGSASLSDVLIRGAPGAIEASAADLELRAVRIESEGTAVDLDAGSASLTDVVFSSFGINSTALRCSGCEVRLERALVELRSNVATGIVIDDARNARVTLVDGRLTGSFPGAPTLRGILVSEEEGALTRWIELIRTRIERLGMALQLLAIDGMLTDVQLAENGFGILVSPGPAPAPVPEVRGTNLAITGYEGCFYGMFVSGGATVELDSISVRSCRHGVITSAAAGVSLRGFRLQQNETGLHLFRNVDQLAGVEYDVDLSDGLVGDNDCGVTYTSLVVPFDFKRVATRVRFAGNGADVEAVAAGVDGSGCPR